MSTAKNINRTNLSPKDALDLLVQGNKRFIENKQQDKNLSEMREALKNIISNHLQLFLAVAIQELHLNSFLTKL